LFFDGIPEDVLFNPRELTDKAGGVDKRTAALAERPTVFDYAYAIIAY
jgi:hypothetical protein